MITDHKVGLLGTFHTYFGPLPQALLPPSRFFLQHPWAFLCFTIPAFGQPFTTWMACNLLECLFLHCLHPHSSPSSSMLSLAILGIYNSPMRSIVRYICLCSFLGSSDKSACQVCLPPYLSHCTDPLLPPQFTLSASPTFFDVWYIIPDVPNILSCMQSSW